MGPLPSPLAELERNYLVLRARVEAGEVSVADAVARMSSDAVFDADGARWRVDPAGSPAHRAVFLRARPGHPEIIADPAMFPPGPPRLPGTAATPPPAARPGTSEPSRPSRPASTPPQSRPRRWQVLAGTAAVVLVFFLLLRSCSPSPSAPGAPPSTPAGLQPLPPG